MPLLPPDDCHELGHATKDASIGVLAKSAAILLGSPVLEYLFIIVSIATRSAPLPGSIQHRSLLGNYAALPDITLPVPGVRQ